jgi:phosphoadenosine phosphosulfate reductase
MTKQEAMIAIKKQQVLANRDFDFDFDDADPTSIIEWAVNNIGSQQLVVATAFGPSGMVNLHLIAQIAPEVPVVFIDTLHHFPETLELADKVEEKYGLDVRIYRPAETREEFERVYGERLWERDLDEFHRLTKIEPMERALVGVAGWFTGRRRDQASSRADMPAVEVGDRIKVNPLAAWTRKDVWKFIHEHNVPYNALHDRGYTSIGDEPLTTDSYRGGRRRAGGAVERPGPPRVRPAHAQLERARGVFSGARS